MNNSIPMIPIPKCEKVKSYSPGSKEEKKSKKNTINCTIKLLLYQCSLMVKILPPIT